jgi:hypothetical protein
MLRIRDVVESSGLMDDRGLALRSEKLFKNRMPWRVPELRRFVLCSCDVVKWQVRIHSAFTSKASLQGTTTAYEVNVI